MSDAGGNAVPGRDEVESPCIKICVIHPESRLCIGCLRTIEEIASWGRLTPEERQAIMDALAVRSPQLARRRGGRAGRLARKRGPAG